MPDSHQINSVNQHYLDKVMALAEERDVKTTEDVYDARGMKLVAKGTRLSRTLQERLLQRRLQKPLESCIAVEEGIGIDAIAAEAQAILDTVEPIRSVLHGLRDGPSPLEVIAGLRFGSAMSTMLTIIQRAGPAALTHSVMVALTATCLAGRRGMSAQEQGAVALAGLLHDIGELYIEPDYLKPDRRLRPHEWRHVVVHPRIGQMLIAGLEHCPTAVAQAVFEHHERFDGSGYPRRIAGDAISAGGQLLSVADLLSGVFLETDKALHRAELALKVIPGEHPHELVSTIAEAMRAAGDAADERKIDASVDPEQAAVQALHARLAAALDCAHGLAGRSAPGSPPSRVLLDETTQRLATIARAFSSTGLDAPLIEGCGFFESHSEQTLFETRVVIREIRRRLRDVARDLSLQGAALDESEGAALQPLIELLDEATTAEHAA